MVSSLSTCFGGAHGVGGERRDATREPGHEPVQLGVGQRPVDPAVALGRVGVEVGRAEDRLHRPPSTEEPPEMLYAAGARWHAEPDLGRPHPQ